MKNCLSQDKEYQKQTSYVISYHYFNINKILTIY